MKFREIPLETKDFEEINEFLYPNTEQNNKNEENNNAQQNNVEKIELLSDDGSDILPDSLEDLKEKQLSQKNKNDDLEL